MGSIVRRIWSLVGHVSRAFFVWQLGGSLVITALLGTVIWALDLFPAPLLVVLIVGLFLLSFASLGVAMPHVVDRLPAAPQPRAIGATLRVDEQRSSIQKVRLIRNEIDEGARIVERAIGVSQVYDLVPDVYWIGHRNELAAISEAGDAHRLAGIAWEGFHRYNYAVKGRKPILDPDLEQIAADGRRAVDALNVAADDLRTR